MSEDGLAQPEMQNGRTGCRRISESAINEEGRTTWARGRIVWTLHEYRWSRFEKQGGAHGGEEDQDQDQEEGEEEEEEVEVHKIDCLTIEKQ